MLWSLLSDELIQRVKTIPDIKIQCYADDSTIYGSGPNAQDCVNRVQKGVDEATRWGRENLLKFSPSKTVAILFTRKRKKPDISRIQVEGNPVEYVELCRHLGLQVDSQLRWGKHLDIKCAAVRKILGKHMAVTGRMWGYKPMIALYVWRGIARPKLTFGCLVWNSVLRLKTRVAQLRRIQARSFRLLAFYRERTPIKGLELVTNTLPLELFVMRTAANAYFRTREFATYTDEEMHTKTVSDIGHRQWISRALQDNDLEWLKDPWDEAPLTRRWAKLFEVDLQSMEVNNNKRGIPQHGDGTEIYTDGSKLEDEACGTGMTVVKNRQVIADGSWYLGTVPSVYQSELYGLKQAAKWILDNKLNIVGSVSVYTDNQAVLHATDGTFLKSELVIETVDLLDQAAQALMDNDMNNKLTIHWCKAHVGHVFNERADTNAKHGASQGGGVVQDPPKMPKATVQLELHKLSCKMWRNMWSNEQSCRQTKHWFPEGPIPTFSHSLLRQPRIVFGQLVGLITGHNYLLKHQSVIDVSMARLVFEDPELEAEAQNSKWCGLCNGGEQSTEHILSHCVALAEERLWHFGTPYPKQPYAFKLPELIYFLKRIGLTNLEMYDNYQEYLNGNLDESQSDADEDTQM